MPRKSIQNICVIGAGRFGEAVIRQLLTMKVSLLVVDKDEANLKMFADLVDKLVVADAADTKTLKALGINDMDIVVVATNDNIEIVAALTELKVDNIIARAKSARHANVLQQIGVNVIIRPEQEAGVRTALLAANPNFAKYSKGLQELGDGFVMGTSLLTNPSLINKTIKECKFVEKGVSIVLIKRGAQSILPNGFSVLQAGDIITILGKVHDVTHVFGLMNKVTK
ncbi:MULTISPECIES: potassium channel family protein [Mycoplasma]|uniref:TrkA family potassium uptake protein n=2 Tax=Mycoplasma TaxID=2093 RepID=A0A6M4JCL7_9MOLU|nr:MULTISPECIES: TrkA family potassium uptake protein [Mycoplasma]MBU4689714.1 TrkA family potassium uptake protein [Mycoplasma zalophidermidis]MBU4690688.1 TrkA family potassium uptake protein [Mycoplasma miroungigenitalium]MBU4691957.1 TrkA family potassium uptake protein [Mycoplasma miroungigenitalium]MBU4693890.1 TrkA family potassium uptake protein [Mycoplasma zalophidermidis]MCR8966654.1 TrkA family potassium uptake protein [Mycoplasma zalophidermidis]